MNICKAWLVLALLFGIIIGVSASGLMQERAAAKPYGEITCYANPSSFLATENWLRLFEADRQRVSMLISEKRAEWRYEPSLVCRDPELQRFVVYEWWWRRI